MKNIIIYDPSIGTLNCGDNIIVESALKNISSTVGDAHYTHISTHMPISNTVLQWFKGTKFSFVCGTNLLKSNLLLHKRMWNIKMCNARYIYPAILIGCGWCEYQTHIDYYSKMLWRSTLSDTFYHSVRDGYTEQKMRQMGFSNVINTGCPTMWRFTEDFCSTIETRKAKNVVTTLTYYRQNLEADQKMLNIISGNYKKVYLWLQGYYDYSYSLNLKMPNNIIIIPNNLIEFDRLLQQEDVEYIGTRLHGGIRALQHKKRSLIIAVDNRALEKNKSFNLNIIKRGDEELINDYVNKNIPCKLKIDANKINTFLEQFK